MSGAAVPGLVSAVDYGTEVSSFGDPVSPKSASVRGVGAPLHWFSVSPSHVGSLSTFLTHNYIELYGLTFAHALFNLLRDIYRVTAVLQTRIFLRVSLYLMKAEPFFTLNQSKVLSSRGFLYLPRFSKMTCLS